GVRLRNGQRGRAHSAHALPRSATHRRLRYSSRFVVHQNGVEPVQFISAACKACDTRRHPDKGPWWRRQRLRTPFRSGKDTAPALLCVSDANKVLIDVGREQTEQGRVLATQDDHVTLFRALRGIRLETRELHSSVRRLLIVAREQHNEVSRVLNSLVHLLDKVCSNRNIVILRANPIAIFLENVGDLLSNGGHRAATAQEEIVSLTGTAWHGRWGRARAL